MRVLTVVGARPQFIKAAPVTRLLRREHEELLVHTGQHYDDAMSEAFFRDLELPAPDRNLGVGSGTHAVTTADMLVGVERAIAEWQPDGVLVYGDTNSTLAGALAAAKAAYPDGRTPWLAHVEAGLRSFNRRMPEERNRVIADHLADLCLAPTSAAMTNLGREGLAERAALVGDVMVDAFTWASERAGRHLPAVAREHDRYVLATLHRAENVDRPPMLRGLLDALQVDVPVIFPVHPRTRAAMAAADITPPENVIAIDPVGYLEMAALVACASLVATDSGGVQKEAYLAGVPCVTLRTETEWVETVQAGWNRVADGDTSAVRLALADREFMTRDRPRPQLFGDGNAAARVVGALEALAGGRLPKVAAETPAP